MTEKRARRVSVPVPERKYLATLSGPTLYARLRDLFNAGWSLSSLAQATTPPRPRTTIRSWILSSSSPSASSAHIGAAENSHPPVPSPFPPASASASASALSARTHAPVRRFSSPRRSRSGIDSSTREKISSLAPLARRHRPRTSPRNPARLANESLTRITRDLYGRGASIPELAEAAGVTYRAMSRRVRGR